MTDVTDVGDVPLECLQVIVVRADNFKSNAGTLSAYTRAKGSTQWHAVKEDLDAKLGSSGIGRAVDDSCQTPVGCFPLGQTFGHVTNPQISFGDYFVADEEDWWDTDWKYWLTEVAKGKHVDSTYNTYVSGPRSDFPPDFELEAIGPTPDNDDDPENSAYDLAVFVDHNPDNIPGCGCAIFLHCDDQTPTWGCVAIDKQELLGLLRWLRTESHPHLSVIVDDPDIGDIDPYTACE
ncbi:hypothetical protein FK535_25490 [Mycolicibacterium sp. 018/SC-01/001]|uniref:hypothetical protein n=1 Tax=Mycolicibacterium sp. 018/SC-01/001 TaxID=2592069 RepID=UPI00117D1741|nr:hypothetical protein [Mycolicibacterium sp. 018/SC-01/001]TRW78318.1 hypothetical protein FK535_25490 [Mycolicibacterium sp. 018/SC-01/001]